ncbi:hypothetical protein [Nocardia jinanensis]|uniref:hypothetical protein n=1 Tax=Nocardia jinanensis TaxID=382504 RepID=UPI0012E385CA|nr:hypothetical protein [Nocardia jinanensis]
MTEQLAVGPPRSGSIVGGARWYPQADNFAVIVVQRPYDDLVRIDCDALPVQIGAAHPRSIEDGPLEYPAGIAIDMADTGGGTQSVRTARNRAGDSTGRRVEDFGHPMHDERPGPPQFDLACHAQKLSAAPISGSIVQYLHQRQRRSE